VYIGTKLGEIVESVISRFRFILYEANGWLAMSTSSYIYP
jgi:hypothetical protein